jgi:peptidyl-tRNA hydrolase, PTH1 family
VQFLIHFLTLYSFYALKTAFLLFLAMKFLIAGLGNIGPEYVDTRHNIGFMVLDALAKKHNASFINDRLAYYTEVKLKGRTIYCIKPTTYMNLSCKALRYWMGQLNIEKQQVLVVVDELALPFGRIQIKPKGSDGGHNGLRNIQELLGGSDYPRLRFGIGNNYPKGQQVNYVLGAFDDNEQKDLPLLIDKAIEMIESFCLQGIELTMTRLNAK